jgi:hypothetical protein
MYGIVRRTTPESDIRKISAVGHVGRKINTSTSESTTWLTLSTSLRRTVPAPLTWCVKMPLLLKNGHSQRDCVMEHPVSRAKMEKNLLHGKQVNHDHQHAKWYNSLGI